MKNRNEGRKKRTRERQRKRKGKKGEVQKRQKRNKGINKPEWPFLGGKQGFSIKTKKGKQRKKNITKKQKNKQNKEGLGPSEVALWATSPDP